MDSFEAEVTAGAIEVGPLRPSGVAAWDAFVKGSADASFFHLASWQRVIEDSFAHRGHYLAATRHGRIEGVLPLVHVRSPMFGNALASLPFCVYGGPVATEPAVAQRLDEAALQLAQSLRVDHLEYLMRRRAHASWPCNDTLYATFRKNIDPDPERNLQAIPRKQRAMVRKGIKSGLRAVWDSSVDVFYGLHAQSQRDLGTPVLSRRYFERLKSAFGTDCQILAIYAGDVAVAAVMIFYFRDEVLPYYAGSNALARMHAANDFMYWEVMREACRRGFRIFDFGRSKRSTGPFDFKRHWGFEPSPLYHEYALLRRKDIPALNPTNPKYALAIRIWKRLPLAVANRLGPPISRSLG